MSNRIRNLTLVILAAPVLVLALTAATANADTITVCWDGSGDYLTIQEGIDAASDGDEVVVCDGTYTGPANKNLDFHGKAITVRSASGDPQLCIIDCENDGRGFYFHSGEAETSVVEGFTITNGYTDGSGGGVYCQDATLTITNCTISSNTTGRGHGGGVLCGNGSLTITDCTISGNRAPGGAQPFGGGVYCQDATLTITNCTISSNQGWAGGGVCCLSTEATVANCTISSNEAVAGGGVCFYVGQTTITDCTISSNEAVAGGGVHCYSSQDTITNCTISGNQASWAGGGVYFTGASPTITNCTISGNQAGDEGGGGVYCENCIATIANCTIADNAANGGNGGGIGIGSYAEEGLVVVTNCLIAGNTATGSGGGLCSRGFFPGEATLTNSTFAHNAAAEYGGAVYCYTDGLTTHLSMTNCILWADLAAEGTEIALRNSVELTTSFSDVQGGEAQVYVDGGAELIWGDGNIDADPLFVDPDNDDFHLSPGSPCIDAACNWCVPRDMADLDKDGDTDESTPFDLDGEGRFFDDPDTDDTGCGCAPIVDMGAYEFGDTGPQPCPGDLDCDRVVGHSDLGILLADWGCDDPVNGCAGDLDCDGVTDQTDLGILLAHWGEGCP